MGARKYLTGQRVGRLTVIDFSDRRHGIARWLCRCDCGTEKVVWQNSLTTGETSSCGCYRDEQSSLRRKASARPALEHVLRKIRIADNGCWEYTGFRNKQGYGRVENVLAHRVVYEALRGSANGLVVCHSCDNPPCCNPAHLFLGTRSDNSADKVAKGRVPRGSQLPQSKITETDVVEIRRRVAAGEPMRVVGAAFGIAQPTVSEIWNRKKWRHVP